MKVNPEQVRALQEAEAAQRARQLREGDGSFGDLLAREVDKGAQAASGNVSAVKPLTSALGATGIFAIQSVGEVEDVNQAGQTAMETVEGLLGEWENYAARLGAGEGDSGLREANDSLEDIESGVQGIRESWPNLSQENPGLGSVVDELEIMAVTERFKFNRGDYLA